jgi:outer membrane protein assembly factor BamB
VDADPMVPSTRRDALRAVGLAGLAGLAGCSALDGLRGPNERPPESLGTDWTPPADEWRSPRGGLRNAAAAPGALDDPPDVAWTVGPPDDPAGSGRPVLAAGETVVSAVARDDRVVLRARDAADGRRRWRRVVSFAPARRYPRIGGLVDGSLFLTDSGTDVLAVDAADGTVRWRVDLHDRVAGAVPGRFLPDRGPAAFSPVARPTPGALYVQTAYGLHGLTPADGHERWRLRLGDRGRDARPNEDPGGIAVGDGRVLASYGRPAPSVYEVRVGSDEPSVDRDAAATRLPARPVVVDGRTVLTDRVVWSTDAGGTLAFGVGGRTDVAWRFPGLASEGPAAYSRLAASEGRAFVCEGDESSETLAVFGLRAADGGLAWLRRESVGGLGAARSDAAAFKLAGPVVVGDTLLVGAGVAPEGAPGRGRLVAFATADGRVRWRTGLPFAPGSLAVAGGRVYVGGRRGGVVALG